MATKAELERENVELRAQIAALGGPRPARADCLNSCPHGERYHGGPVCPGEPYGNVSIPCACPIHPDDPPLPKRVHK